MFPVVCIFKVVLLVNEKVADGFVAVEPKDDASIVVLSEVTTPVVSSVALGWVAVWDSVSGFNVTSV